MIIGAVILGLLASPFLALAEATFRALILFWPTMIAFGALHSHIDWVPALDHKASFLVVLLLGLLIPTGGSASSGS